MLEFDFEKSVGYWVFATTHEMCRAMNEELSAHGITYRQWEVLAWISKAGGQSQSELAERMLIEPPTLVGVLDRMERDGWIERIPADGDRRKKLVRATPRVEPLWAKMVACAHRVRAKAVQNLRPEQLGDLRDILATIRENLNEAGPAAPLPPSPAASAAASGTYP
jgi:MarR family transcriptional regulator for hemolysin